MPSFRPLALRLECILFLYVVQYTPSPAVTIKPEISFEVHTTNKLWLGISNWDDIGQLVYWPDNLSIGNYIGYPGPMGTSHPSLYFEVGGIVNRDTLVSAFFGEFLPPSRNSPNYDSEKLVREKPSEGDHSIEPLPDEMTNCVYLDTLTNELLNPDALDGRDHRPMNLRVRQVTRSWSFEHVDDIVFITLEIENIGHTRIDEGYVGALLWGETIARVNADAGSFLYCDDIVGFIDDCFSYKAQFSECKFDGCLHLMWHSDNDGDPNYLTDEFGVLSATSAVGVSLVDAPAVARNVSFNWAHALSSSRADFRPQLRSSLGAPTRVIQTAFGDRDVYHELSNGEVDYDQVFTSIDHSAEGWESPPQFAIDHDTTSGRGVEQQILQRLSVGPFTLGPGESVPFTFAFVGCDNFHTVPRNLVDNFDAQNPQKFYDGLNFSDLIKNGTWANWTYDNPGYDTDNDGYKGQFHTCLRDSIVIDTVFAIDSSIVPRDSTIIFDTILKVQVIDTIYYTGDGIPDWRPVSPPSAPECEIIPSKGKLIINWYGLESETTPDIFTNDLDFEGYRVYVGLEKSRTGMALVASYDREDYTQYYLNPKKGVGGTWEVLRKPYSLKEIQRNYADGNTHFDPLSTDTSHPLRRGDSAFYFVSTDWNQSEIHDATRIHKVYPEAPYPHTLDVGKAFSHDTLYINSLTGDSIFYEGGELTPDGRHFKYFEYRYYVESLLPSQVYYVAVTAFDYGSIEFGIGALETDKSRDAIESLAQNPVNQSPSGGLNVTVYPNPFRIDGHYRDDGFEGRGREDYIEDLVHSIHFSNLPPVCRISVYSLDGDLIWFKDHNRPDDAPNAMHETWNVVTRNRQQPVSGLYYWTIETSEGLRQVGKLVLVM